MSRKARKRNRARLRRLAVRVATVIVALVFVLLGYELLRWPDVAALAEHDPSTWAMLEHVRRTEGEPERIWVPYQEISPELARAVVVAEDIGFFSHHGFAPDEIRTAVRETLAEGKRLRGASTITQQLAKNLWLSTARSPLRKLREALLTVSLERHLSKRRILELYLNVVQFAPGTIGAEAAARRYLGVSAADLDREQAAALAASLPASSWYPGAESRRYRAHHQRVLERARQADWLDALL